VELTEFERNLIRARASKDRRGAARVGLGRASRMRSPNSDRDYASDGHRPRTSRDMAFNKSFLCRYPIDWDTERHRHLIPNTREISLAARDSHDRFLDIRRQPVPTRDKLA
jgi:hypothetical protein